MFCDGRSHNRHVSASFASMARRGLDLHSTPESCRLSTLALILGWMAKDHAAVFTRKALKTPSAVRGQAVPLRATRASAEASV